MNKQDNETEANLTDMMRQSKNSHLYRSSDNQTWDRVGGPYDDEDAILVYDQQRRVEEEYRAQTRRGFLFAVITFETGTEIPERIQASGEELLRRRRPTL